MKYPWLALAAIASMLFGGCDLVGDGHSTKLVEKRATFHFPPQVEAGKPFSIYADYDTGCGENAEVTTSINEESRTITAQLLEWRKVDQPCEGIISMMRTTKSLTLAHAGTYQVAANNFSTGLSATSTTTIQVLPAGQPAPEWTPVPLNEGRYVVPTGSLTGRVVDGTTGAGLESVKISIRDVMPAVEVYTDRDGHFVLGKVPQGDQIIDVTKVGFAVRGDRLIAKVRPNSTVTIDEIVLEPLSAPLSPSPTPSTK